MDRTGLLFINNVCVESFFQTNVAALRYAECKFNTSCFEPENFVSLHRKSRQPRTGCLFLWILRKNMPCKRV